MTPEKFSKIVLHPGGGFLRPVAEGVGNCLQPVSEGSRGKHHARGVGGKSHTTPHNTTPIPDHPRPHHNTPITDTQTLHAAPHNTRNPTTPHQASLQAQHQHKPPFKKTPFSPQKMHLFEIAPKPGPNRHPTLPPPPDAASFWNAGTPLFQNDDVTVYIGAQNSQRKARQPPRGTPQDLCHQIVLLVNRINGPNRTIW